MTRALIRLAAWKSDDNAREWVIRNSLNNIEVFVSYRDRSIRRIFSLTQVEAAKFDLLDYEVAKMLELLSDRYDATACGSSSTRLGAAPCSGQQ